MTNRLYHKTFFQFSHNERRIKREVELITRSLDIEAQKRNEFLPLLRFQLIDDKVKMQFV